MAAPSPRARLLALHVGQPQTRGSEGAADPLDRPWTSAIFKQPVDSAVWLTRTNLTGDRQADLGHHGGPDKAVLVYAAAHYPRWRAELDWPDLGFGGFGENFTVEGLTENDVSIGDTFVVGGARVQVSQPRAPCWKLERRWHRPGLEKLVQEARRTGWYLRVLDEGEVAAGLEVELVERPCPEWTVARAAQVMRRRHEQPALAAELAASPYLSAAWRATLGGP